jgi:hypothetical protein
VHFERNLSRWLVDKKNCPDRSLWTNANSNQNTRRGFGLLRRSFRSSEASGAPARWSLHVEPPGDKIQRILFRILEPSTATRYKVPTPTPLSEAVPFQPPFPTRQLTSQRTDFAGGVFIRTRTDFHKCNLIELSESPMRPNKKRQQMLVSFGLTMQSRFVTLPIRVRSRCPKGDEK